MPNFDSSEISNDTASDPMKIRSTSMSPASFELQMTYETPSTMKSSIEATSARAAKRKAAFKTADESQSTSKKPKTSDGVVIKNKGGRPKKETSAQIRQRACPTRFRVSRPVKTFLPPEIWQNILEQSSPALLLRARVLNRNFYSSLTTGKQLSLWIRARRTEYGSDHPGPPSGLNEIQYADLLEGQGCQSCSNRKTRKTYWAFLRRWCESCFHEKIVTEATATDIMRPYADHFRGCVPQAFMDSWNHYQYINSAALPPPTWATRGRHGHTVYLKPGPEGLDALKVKADAFLQSGPTGVLKTEDELSRFFEDLRTDMTQKTSQRRVVEDWEMAVRGKHRTKTREVLDARCKAIDERASKMNPPLDKAQLSKLMAYQKALHIPKPLSERSWRELQPKLLSQHEVYCKNVERRTEEKDQSPNSTAGWTADYATIERSDSQVSENQNNAIRGLAESARSNHSGFSHLDDAINAAQELPELALLNDSSSSVSRLAPLSTNHMNHSTQTSISNAYGSQGTPQYHGLPALNDSFPPFNGIDDTSTTSGIHHFHLPSLSDLPSQRSDPFGILKGSPSNPYNTGLPNDSVILPMGIYQAMLRQQQAWNNLS